MTLPPAAAASTGGAGPPKPVPSAADWPIAAAMLQFPNVHEDGSSVQDDPADAWALTLAEVADAGFTELDPTDSWLRIADLSEVRLGEFVHVKNYARIDDATTGAIMTAPVPLESGVMNYRHAIRTAVALGFRGPFCAEPYGGDGLSVSATNREYLRRILPR